MTEKQKDTRRHGMWNKETAQEKRRAHHRVNMRPSPQWIEAKMADLPERSRLRLLYDANDCNVLRQGPAGLSHLVRLTIPHLSLPQPGWKQFGFTVFREEEGVTVPGLGTLVSIRWQFVLEWSQSRSAWDALFFSLHHLHLNLFALPPAYVIPTLFVVCMADRPDDSLLNMIVAAWGPVLHEICQALDPLLRAFSPCWIDGPSRSAFRYRQFIEYRPTDGVDYWQFIDPLSCIIGPENIEMIRSSEHFEATIIQQLLQASVRLWTKGSLPFSKQDLFTMLSTSHLRSLLPLALWSPSSPVKLEADTVLPHSLDDVLHLWKHHMAID